MEPEFPSPEEIKEYWQLYLRRMPGGYREIYEVNPDILWGSFMQELTRNGFCPSKNSQGVPQSWRGSCRGKELEDKTIREQCRPEDEIWLDSEMSGGAYEEIREVRIKAECRILEKLVEEQKGSMEFSALARSELRGGFSQGFMLVFHCKGFAPGNDILEPLEKDIHKAYLYLPHGYPDDHPVLQMHTPCYHPNIDENNGWVCIKEATTRYRTGYSLKDIVLTLQKMIGYKNYDPTDPFNRNAVVFALSRPERIRAIGGTPDKYCNNPVDPERVWSYLRWIQESGHQGDIYVLKRWMETGKPPDAAGDNIRRLGPA